MELTNKIINSFLCLSASAALGAGGMYLYHRDAIKNNGNDKLVEECEGILEKAGVDFPDGADKSEALLKGYLSAYNDRYTFYSKSDGAEEYLMSVNSLSCLITCGYKVGVGDGGTLIVTSVESGGIADKQGLKAGDEIIQVDDISVQADGIAKTAFELSGKDGTTMHLVIMRDGIKKELDFVRANDYDLGKDNVEISEIQDVLYVQICGGFDDYTPLMMNAKLADHEKNCTKLIIDLRDNVGGKTEGSINTADRFLSEGTSVDHFYTGDIIRYNLTADENDLQVPTVLLVNNNTASAAEIFTALLKQYGKDVTIVGENTFGKGIFQREEELSNGGVLRYTAGYFTVGDWECFQGKGIAPDVEVKMDRELIGTDDDIQLKKALELLG